MLFYCWAAMLLLLVFMWAGLSFFLNTGDAIHKPSSIKCFENIFLNPFSTGTALAPVKYIVSIDWSALFSERLILPVLYKSHSDRHDIA